MKNGKIKWEKKHKNKSIVIIEESKTLEWNYTTTISQQSFFQTINKSIVIIEESKTLEWNYTTTISQQSFFQTISYERKIGRENVHTHYHPTRDTTTFNKKTICKICTKLASTYFVPEVNLY